MHLVASVYSQRPSAILGIEDARLAYDFDLSVAVIALGANSPKQNDPEQWGDWKALAANRGK